MQEYKLSAFPPCVGHQHLRHLGMKAVRRRQGVLVVTPRVIAQEDEEVCRRVLLLGVTCPTKTPLAPAGPRGAARPATPTLGASYTDFPLILYLHFLHHLHEVGHAPCWNGSGGTTNGWCTLLT